MRCELLLKTRFNLITIEEQQVTIKIFFSVSKVYCVRKIFSVAAAAQVATVEYLNAVLIIAAAPVYHVYIYDMSKTRGISRFFATLY